MKINPVRHWVNGAALLLGLLLFWFFARQLNWTDSLILLRRVGPMPFLLYLSINFGIAILLANRWWLLLAGLGVRLPFGRVAVYRMIAATVSLLTPGPQFGGEPAQIYLLVRRSGVAPSTAIAAVAIDRLLELAINLVFLAVGILYTLWTNALGTDLDSQVVLFALLPLAVPLILLVVLWRQGPLLATAIHALVARLPVRWQRRAPLHLVESLAQGEAHIHTILHKNPQLLVMGALVSVGNWAVLLADFWLATHLIGLQLDFGQFISFVVAARVAILLPIPAGLGALEASQIFAAQRLGLNPALGLGLVLLFRVRDVALALWGLWLAWQERRAHVVLLQPPVETGQFIQAETQREIE